MSDDLSDCIDHVEKIEAELATAKVEIDRLREVVKTAIAYTKHGHPCAPDCIKCLLLQAMLEASRSR